MRSLLAALATLAFVGTALAEEAKPGLGRYAIEPSMDGFIRLDTTTGAVSHCSRREGVWHCDVIVDNATGLSEQIGKLSAEVGKLTSEVSSLRARVEALEGHAAADSGPVVTEDAQVDQAMGFAERLMRRFFGLVREMKRDTADPS
jgi:hypothetical protein